MGGFKYIGDVKLLGSYDVNTKRPLDNRNVVQSVKDLYEIRHFYSYVGMPVVVIEEAAMYVLIDDDKRATPEGWKKIGSVNINTESGIIDITNLIQNEIGKYMEKNTLTNKEVRNIFNTVFDTF